MSFRWKGLLGVGGGGPGVAANGGGGGGGVNGTDPAAAAIFLDEEPDWKVQYTDPKDLPNMLGFENFGNTCYVNSVMQALYFCDPFRESLLSYEKADAGGAESNSDETLFFALRTLFERMASASVPLSHVVDGPILPASSSSGSLLSSSYLGGGLSRRVSSRPATANARPISSGAGIGAGALPLAPIGFMPTSASATTAIPKGGLNSCSNIVVPDTDIKTFLGSLKKSNILFDSTAHQDAHELFNFVLNRIGEDIQVDGKRAKRRDPIHDGQTLVQRLFEGTLTNETRCLTCETTTSRDECFLDLSLDIERNSSVTACLRQFSAREMLCARNKFFCDTCSGLQEAEKRMKIKKLPNILALHLKRFKYEESVQRFVKLAYRVVFPMQLRLFNTSDDAQDPDKLYELYGIIVHLGAGPHHGHYVAIIKVGERWFVFDDETISVIDEQDLARYYGDTPGSGSAYVLFYQAVELDMQGLGLPDLKAIRAEKVRARREASIKRQIGLKVVTGGQKGIGQPLASPNAMSGPSSDWPENPSSETPSRTGTPSAEGRAGGLFGRRAGGNAASSATGGSTAETPGQQPTSASWLSSLRGRKGSVSQHAAAGISAGQNGDEEATSRQTSPMRGRQPVADGQEGGGVSAPVRSLSTDAASQMLSNSPQRVPPLSLDSPSPAAFQPADRSLSKKDQEKIAKQARRATHSSVVAPDVPTSPIKAEPEPTAASPWRKVTGIPPRKPTATAEQQPTPSPSRRRSTLSRAFGFGRKDEKPA